MGRTRRNQTNSASASILLRSVSIVYHSDSNAFTDLCAMVQLPPRLRCLPGEENWKPVKDEIRGVALIHGLADIPDEALDVAVCDGHGSLFANCQFTNKDDAREVFSMCIGGRCFLNLLIVCWIELIRGHVFEGRALQAWLFELGRSGPNLLDGPKDPVGGGILLPVPPAWLNLSSSQPRTSRGPLRPRANHAGPPTHNTVVSRPGRNPSVSHDHVFPQFLPPASIPMQDAFNKNDAVVLPLVSAYTKNLDSYPKPLRYFSPLVGDASEVSDLSRTLHNSPDFSPSSRTSSVSAIADAYSPARSSSYSNFQHIPDSPHANRNSSISSSSSPYTASSSRNQSGSLHAFRDIASNEAYKVIIRNVKAGVTHKQLSELLDQEMPEYSYMQYERPKQGEDNKWSVQFSKEEDAEKAREQLHNLGFEGRKLKVHLSNGPPRRQVNSGGSTTSATSSSMTPGPTIVDGSVTG